MNDRTVSLYLPEPPSANRWWRRAGTHMHISTEAKAYKADVAMRALIAKVKKFDRPTPVVVDLIWWRKRKAGDLDKRLGIVLDALQGIVYDTDGQIVEIHARRADTTDTASLVVHVWPAGVLGGETQTEK